VRVINLVAENVKKLVAIDITPEGHVVEITGQNGAGKTSVLDAIWWALAGERPIQSHPIRDGEERAKIKLDLGELIVTRRFRSKKGGGFTTDVTVEHGDGSTLKSPQKILDALVGTLTFDPLDFKRMSAKEQYEELKRLTGLDFAALELANKADFDARTGTNRLVREYKALLASMPEIEAPAADVDEDAIVAQLRDAGAHNADIERRAANRKTAEDRIEAIQNEIRKLTDEMHGLQTRLMQAPALPALIDPQALVLKLEEAKAGNRARVKVKERAEMVAKIAQVEQQSDNLTLAIDEREKEKRRLISEVEMPVEGLGFGDGFVTLAEQPFDQASDAEQLRASVAIAAAMNPKLRVIRVRDGSLLDDTSMAMLADFAAEKDFQVWVEVVDSDRPGAIVIEEGRVAGVVPGDDETGGPSKTEHPQSTAQPAESAKPSSASATAARAALPENGASTLLMPAQPSNAGEEEDDELEF
jgi:energy-coupling factor transporter ATP-binding protein EcfA2